MTEKKKSGKGRIIVIVLLAIALGAAAIVGLFVLPAFAKYANASKVVEARLKTLEIKQSVERFYLKECKFPKNAVSSALPKDGVKIVPDFSKDGWKDIGMNSAQSVYFRYRLVNEGNTMKIIADMDISTSSPEAHTLTLIMTAGPDCSLNSARAKVTNKYQ